MTNDQSEEIPGALVEPDWPIAHASRPQPRWRAFGPDGALAGEYRGLCWAMRAARGRLPWFDAERAGARVEPIANA